MFCQWLTSIPSVRFMPGDVGAGVGFGVVAGVGVGFGTAWVSSRRRLNRPDARVEVGLPNSALTLWPLMLLIRYQYGPATALPAQVVFQLPPVDRGARP